MSWKDPALRGFKVIPTPRGNVFLKCMGSCREHGNRVSVRLPNMTEAHDWALRHRERHPEHDTPCVVT